MKQNLNYKSLGVSILQQVLFEAQLRAITENKVYKN